MLALYPGPDKLALPIVDTLQHHNTLTGLYGDLNKVVVRKWTLIKINIEEF